MNAHDTIKTNRVGMPGPVVSRLERATAPTAVMSVGGVAEVLGAPDVLAELKAAHVIIRNALNLMTEVQRREWARLNDRDGVIGEGTTRAHEREVAITCANSST